MSSSVCRIARCATKINPYSASVFSSFAWNVVCLIKFAEKETQEIMGRIVFWDATPCTLVDMSGNLASIPGKGNIFSYFRWYSLSCYPVGTARAVPCGKAADVSDQALPFTVALTHICT